jgi:CubicO group peptidase (beta-lactamase class C family)
MALILDTHSIKEINMPRHLWSLTIFTFPAFSVCLFLGSGIGSAQTQGSGPIVPELAPLESAMTNYLAAHQFGAGTLALMHGSKLVLRQGYGWRDSNFTKVIHPDNLFRLASVSKMLTASAIYKLVDAGKIATNTLVYSYLGIPPWGGALGDNRISTITVQNLLDHKGGWDNTISPVGDPVFRTIEISTEMGLAYPAAATNVISWMFSKPLDHAPGTTYAYANLGYQILGRVIEKASGKSYINYIQQDLLGSAAISNALGFTNVIQSRSRPSDLAPLEIWYGEPTPYLERSAVDFPTNLLVRDVDGGLYYESFDSFGGVSASAIGLCHYLLNYWEGGHLRPTGGNYSWNYTFFGSLPGASSVLYQNISQNATATNGLEFAALFNERDGATPGQDNSEALTAITSAAASITSWPTNGGGMIQWSTAATNVNKNAGSVIVSLLRSGVSTLPVKVSYTTYALTAGSSNYRTTSGIVNFAPGVTGQNVTVPILNDGFIDPTLRFSLELISASGGAWLGNQLSSVVSILDTNTPPKFTGSPIIQPNGNVQFQFMSSTGLVLTVEYTSDFSNWQPVQTFTNTTTVNTFTDTNASGRIQSFYRLVVP